MKPRDLADILNAYGAALSSVGGRSQADALAKLAQALTTGSEATVAAVIKRWNGLSFETTRSSPTLRDTARLIDPLSRILAVGAKAASTDLAAIRAFLEERSAVSLALLVERGGASVTKTGASKPAQPLRQALVDEHARRLRESLSDPSRFSLAFDALSDLPLPELVAVAKALTNVAPRTKAAALKKISALHNSISGFDAKVRATGGRSAA